MSTKLISWSLVVLVFLLSISLFIGRYPFPENLNLAFQNDLYINLVSRVRLPRILFSVLVGFGLSVSGLIMQNIFKNPLADPGLLGINQAAGFGAALGILIFSNSFFAVQLLAFIFGILSMLLAIILSKNIKKDERLSLVLAGISVSALFSAGLGIIKYIADPLDELPSIVFWLLGSISNTNWDHLFGVLPIVICCLVILYLYRWRINVYSLNKEVLFSLGIKNDWELYLILGTSILLTTSLISYSGIVGWVGLIIPNISRILMGQNTKNSLPLAMIFGGIFVLICDNLARSLLPGEIPLGIITAFLGAFGFISFLIFRRDFL
ncbi:MAG: iron ABC transporter permease [Pelolinea sp.]|nr:iron ABC transporter permease [Pelolinea sp.]